MTHSTVQRAEALLRSLVGITAAEVRLSPGGRVESVRVATACALSNGQVVQNVRSALFAGLGVRVDPAQIELVDATAWVPGAPAPASASNGASQANGNGRAHPGANGNGKHGGNGVHGAYPGGNGNGNGNGAHAPVHGDDTSVSESGLRPAHRLADALEQAAVVEAPPLSAAVPLSNGANGHHPAGCGAVHRPTPVVAERTAAPTLESVELLRQSGRTRCRVVVAAGAERYTAVADTAGEPTHDVQLAARVTCDALRAGRLTTAQLDGATVASLAGRSHVVVALSDWRAGVGPVNLTGSAVVADTPEHAAAVAVLQALHGTF